MIEASGYQSAELQNLSPYSLEGHPGYVLAAPYEAAFWLPKDNSSQALVIEAGCDCEGMQERLLTVLQGTTLLED